LHFLKCLQLDVYPTTVNMEENALSPGPCFTVIVMIQATWELPAITVSKPTRTVFSTTPCMSGCT